MAIANTFGFTRRDVARIKAQAEAVAAIAGLDTPAALADLDAPWRVLAVKPAEASRFSGEPFGTWAGMTLLVWPRRPPRRP